MKRTCILVAILTRAAVASASVRVFVTPASAGYGLTNPDLAFTPTLSTVTDSGEDFNAYDCIPPDPLYAVDTYPPLDVATGTATYPVLIPPGDFAYIWFRFQDVAENTHVDQIKVAIREYSNGALGDVTTCYYVLNSAAGDPPRKRWDGVATPPDYPFWHMNPQPLLAHDGLLNGADDPQLLFKHQSGGNPRTGVALLGAVLAAPDKTYVILPEELNFDVVPPDPLIWGGYFLFMPEPGALSLLALGVMGLRRR